MERRPRFRFSLLGLLGAVTFASLAFAGIRDPFWFSLTIAPPFSFVSTGLGVLMVASFMCDVRFAIKSNSWAPTRTWFHWVFLLFFGFVILWPFCLAEILSDLKQPGDREIVGGMSLAFAIGGFFAAVWRITDPAFSVRPSRTNDETPPRGEH